MRLYLTILVFLLATSASASKYAATVINAKTGEVLFSDGPDRRLHPAGLTKLMTLYVVFDAVENGEVDLDDKVLISRHAASVPPVKMGLRYDQNVRLRYLIRAAGVHGSNDASTALAEFIEGSEGAFARRMNKTAKAMEMHRTSFKNAHGLTESGHLSSASDMALLIKKLHDDFPDYFNLFGRRSTHIGVKNVKHSGRSLLSDDFRILGAKTGYTRAAGYNGLTYSVSGSKKIITVVFGGRSKTTRNALIKKLNNLGFSKAN